MTIWTAQAFRAASISFWSDKPAAARLRDCLRLYLEAVPTPTDQLHRQVQNVRENTLDFRDQPGFMVTAKTLGNMSAPGAPSPQEKTRPFYSLLLLTLCDKAGYGVDDLRSDAEAPGRSSRLDPRDEAHQALTGTLRTLGRAFCHACAADGERPAAPATDDGFSHAVALLRGASGVDQIIRQFYLAETTEMHTYFDTFRYGAEPGMIHRGFLALCKPERAGLTCTFGHYHALADGGNAKSVRRGMVVSYGSEIAFLGGWADGGSPSAEIILVPARSDHIETIDGLILTTDDSFNRLSSRIVLSRSEDIRHSPHTGLHRAADVIAQFPRLKLRERLRNEVAFNLDQKLRLDGKVVNQKTMVVKVEEMLGDRFTLEGRDPAGPPELFNPADSSQYTFNAALKKR